MVCISRQSLRTPDQVVSVRGSHDPGPFLFSYPYPVLYCGNTDSPDMTLIAAVWSPEGFAISADGFQVETNQPDRYDAQKIFHTPFHNDTGFAYACAGTCRWSFQSGDYFDFIEATHRATDNLANRPFPNDPADYFNEIGRRVFQELAFPLDGDIDGTSNHGFAESKLLFAGYANGSPLWAQLIFSNTGTRFAPHVLAGLTYSPRQFMVFAGSTTVYGDMQIAGKLLQPLNLQEAIRMVHEYAQICVASNESIADCANLKGDIHVATITKEKFTWIIEPKNLKK
jgi:hypothetical protein